MNQPIVLCGLGRLGLSIVETLRAAKLDVVVIDLKAPSKDPRLDGVRLIQGDCRDRHTLEQAGVANARGVIVATSDDLANVAAALQVRSLRADIRIVIRMFNQNLLSRLGKTVSNVFALSVSALTAPMLALAALTGETLASFACGGEPFQIAQVRVQPTSPLTGSTLQAIEDRQHLVAVAHRRPNQFARMLLDVDARAVTQANDELVLCGSPAALGVLLQQEEDLVKARWAGWLKRSARMLWRGFAEIDAAVKICLAALLLVVVASTLVYHVGMDQSLTDGMYRTVSVMTTAADPGGAELAEGWQKVFVSALRVLGMALMAAFTAIVTNYLLRVRLAGVLELRRVPEAGHIVVCGLGNIGYRVTEHLVRLGQQVVVIEPDQGGRFVGTARRLGAAVIHGDATLIEVLREAHAATARAIVVATSDALANLEIAFLARELHPRQRVVVRMLEADLAQKLRESANIKLAFSTTAIAAPAFIAALFGDRVLSIFLLEGRVLAVLDLRVDEDEPHLLGRTIRELMQSYPCRPVRLVRNGLNVPGDLLEVRLEPQDQLMIVLELTNLGRLMRGRDLSSSG